MNVVKSVECEDFSHKCEIECPLCRLKIKGNYARYKLKGGTTKAAIGGTQIFHVIARMCMSILKI